MDDSEGLVAEIISGLPHMPAPITAAISKVMGGVKKLNKSALNAYAGYKYASADDFFETIGPMMAAANLVIVANQVEWEIRSFSAPKGERHMLFVTFDFIFASGGDTWQMPLRRTVSIEAGGAQQWGALQTYAEKQFLRQLFKVPTGEPDADADEPIKDVPLPKVVPVLAVGREDVVSNFLNTLAGKQTPEDAIDLLQQFRAGAGKLISKADQKRCSEAFDQMMDKLQRFKADG